MNRSRCNNGKRSNRAPQPARNSNYTTDRQYTKHVEQAPINFTISAKQLHIYAAHCYNYNYAAEYTELANILEGCLKAIYDVNAKHGAKQVVDSKVIWLNSKAAPLFTQTIPKAVKSYRSNIPPHEFKYTIPSMLDVSIEFPAALNTYADPTLWYCLFRSALITEDIGLTFKPLFYTGIAKIRYNCLQSGAITSHAKIYAGFKEPATESSVQQISKIKDMFTRGTGPDGWPLMVDGEIIYVQTSPTAQPTPRKIVSTGFFPDLEDTIGYNWREPAKLSVNDKDLRQSYALNILTGNYFFANSELISISNGVNPSLFVDFPMNRKYDLDELIAITENIDYDAINRLPTSKRMNTIYRIANWISSAVNNYIKYTTGTDTIDTVEDLINNDVASFRAYIDLNRGKLSDGYSRFADSVIHYTDDMISDSETLYIVGRASSAILNVFRESFIATPQLIISLTNCVASLFGSDIIKRITPFFKQQNLRHYLALQYALILENPNVNYQDDVSEIIDSKTKFDEISIMYMLVLAKRMIKDMIDPEQFTKSHSADINLWFILALCMMMCVETEDVERYKMMYMNHISKLYSNIVAKSDMTEYAPAYIIGRIQELPISL